MHSVKEMFQIKYKCYGNPKQISERKNSIYFENSPMKVRKC